MSADLLTEAQLVHMRLRCETSTDPALKQLFRAYESLVQQVERLNGELRKAEVYRVRAETDLATERAAREADRKAWLAACAKLEDARDVLRLAHATGSVPALVRAQFEACLDPEATPLAAAERERDTALARVKELEALLLGSGLEARCKAAESALASAESGWHTERERAQDLEQQNGVLRHDLDELWRAWDTLSEDARSAALEATNITQLSSHPAAAPVAGPCAGCISPAMLAEFEMGTERRRALEQAIDAAVAELDATRWFGRTSGPIDELMRTPEGHNCTRVNSALAALRAARKGGGA